MASFSDRLRYLRERSGFSQAEMADILTSLGGAKVSRSTVGMWESGRRMPSRESLETMADYFNVPMDYLLGREDDPTSSPSYEFPEEITMIARAGVKMSPERRADMLRMLRVVFPEEFEDSE